jgi:hypothetical protein
MKMKWLTGTARILSFALILTIFLLYIVLLEDRSMPIYQNLSLMLLYIIFAICSIGFYLSISKAYLFQGITWSFWMTFLCIAPIVQIKMNKFPLQADTSATNNQLSVIIILIATIFLLIGSTLPSKDRKSALLINNGGNKSENFIRALSLLALLSFLVIVFRSSLSVFLLTRYEFEQATQYAFINPQVGLIVVNLCRMTSVICASYFLMNSKSDGLRRLGPLLRTFFILQAVYVNNPISSSRLSFIAMLIVIILSIGKVRENLIRYSILSIVPFYLFIFPLLDRFRYRNVLSKKTGLYETFLNPDFDAYQQLSNTITFVEERGYQMGEQFLGAIMLFVPNEFWTSKPIPSGPLVASSVNLRFTNLSSPIPAESFIDFGFVGVIIYAFVIGKLIFRVDRYIKKKEILKEFSSIPLILLLTLSGQLTLLLRGALIGVAGPSILIMLIYFLYVITKRKVY